MKILFLIDGAAGTGKTDMLEYIREKYLRGNLVTIIPKFTTRAQRPEEINRNLLLDLKFISQKEFNKYTKNPLFYSYEYGGERYGFYKTELDEALAKYQNVFIIVRDKITIQRIKEDYRHVYTVPVFIYTDRDLIIQRLKKEGYDDNAINFRLERQELVTDDYFRHPELYKEVIVNISNKRDFCRLIDILLAKYSLEPSDVLVISHCESFPIIKPLVGFKKSIQNRLKRYPYEHNVFLMMKFRDSNKLISNFIKTHLEKNGFNCLRADQREWNITNNVYNPIAVLYCCKYGIALFDEPEKGNHFSPNVAYELGMMHLQGKECLILRHTSLPSMPFDLVGDLHKPYSRDLELEEIVLDWIKKIKEDGGLS